MTQTLAELLGISSKAVDSNHVRLATLEKAVSPLAVLENADIVAGLKATGFTENEIADRLGISQPIVNRYLKIAKRWSEEVKAIIRQNAQMFDPMEVWGWARLQWSDVKTPGRKGRGGRSLVRFLNDRLRLKNSYRRGRGQKRLDQASLEQIELDHEYEMAKLRGKIHELEAALKRLAIPATQNGDDSYVEERIKNALKMKVALNSAIQRIEIRGFGYSPHFKALVQKIYELAEETENFRTNRIK